MLELITPLLLPRMVKTGKVLKMVCSGIKFWDTTLLKK